MPEAGRPSAPSGPFSRLYDHPYLVLSIATLGWAGTAVAGRLTAGHVSPMAIAVLRLLVVLIVLALFAHRTLRGTWREALPHWRYILAMGALGYTIFSVFFYWSAQHTTAVNLGVIMGIAPAFILTGSFLAFGTRFSTTQAAGALLTLIGVAAVASRGSWDALRSASFNVGDLAALGATILYSGYSVALRHRPAIDPLLLFSAMTFAAFLVAVPLPLIEMWQGNLVWPSDLRGWALILFIGIVPSFISQITYMRGVALIGPGRAGVFVNLMPVASAFLGVAILGEIFASYHAVGLALVLGGVWLAERRVRAS